MGIGKIIKGGLTGGLIGAARAGGVSLGDIARHGGFGLAGMALAKKKQREEDIPVGGATRRMIEEEGRAEPTMKKGGKVKKMAKGGSASRRGDGCATKGKTKGRFV